MLDLLNTPHCDRGNTFHCMAKRVSNYVMQFEPPLNWMPQQLKSIAGTSQEGIDRLFTMIFDLLNTPHCDRGNTFHCMAKRVSTYVMQFEPPLNWMPPQVQSIAGTHVNSVATLVTVGNVLKDCANIQSSGELTKCLGLKIISSVPPLNFLSRMKEVLAEMILTFARVATQASGRAASVTQVVCCRMFIARSARVAKDFCCGFEQLACHCPRW